ncbi:TetR/AcrR family transcriptional regulator [Robbsia andropogonis]|uniref:TetR/AcrR family transcriptional regulator n=1 Tax=Robbsia andropogonis TaxID=28092 RepID=UPI000466EE6E|nr:TetR/AcrR family transcriptional regulator [Robbsia andropogonis]
MNKKPNPRLSREASRALTRERLLDAAAVLVERQGLASASVEDVVAEAGFSRGAFYSNFDDKAALLLALLRREQQRLIDELAQVFSGDLPPLDLEQAVLAYYQNLRCNRICFLGWMEAKLMAIRDPSFRETLRELMAEGYAVIADFVEAYRERVGSSAVNNEKGGAEISSTARALIVLPAEQLAIGLIAMCDGMNLTHLADPETVTEPMMAAVLSHYFESLLGRAAG